MSNISLTNGEVYRFAKEDNVLICTYASDYATAGLVVNSNLIVNSTLRIKPDAPGPLHIDASGTNEDATIRFTGHELQNKWTMGVPVGSDEFRIDQNFTLQSPFFAIDNSGTVSALNFSETSDIRTKLDVCNLSGSLSLVKRLQGVSYTTKINSNTQIGLIAQATEDVMPDVVTTSTKQLDGHMVDDFKTLSYTRIIPHLIESIKEQQTQIEQLSTRLNEMENIK